MSTCSGYMPPKYVLQGHFSVKSDVFSFDVLILEMVIGQKNNTFCGEENGEGLLNYVSTSIFTYILAHSLIQ